MFPPNIRHPRGHHPQGVNPFQYPNQHIQRRDFIMPQQPRSGPRGQKPLGQRRPTQGVGSLIRDENGKIDLVKIGNGVQNVMGVVNQAGPVVSMFKGFLR
ncbi:YppG family protein [Aquibacillus saliphilus]|uniref:YppG family protein n=1 Tax=Aquibacillus saliphilus TaxID=1909422 RepID=UPI001CEFEB14|nr:YppG family protein [Aquibacillus saliphilus]